ncbi:MAG: hypothetical protein ACLRXC_12605 [[Clostridium] leptum]
MGFIEKVVSLMNGSPEQETGSGPATPEEPRRCSPRPRTPADAAQEAVQQPKTYTQEN